MKNISIGLFLYCCCFFLSIACGRRQETPTDDDISEINLKRGNVVLCSPAEKQFGQVDFPSSCNGKAKALMQLAIALLHSFEYDESEKVFAQVIDVDPGCAMAYWGIAMSNYHQVWPSPPTEAEIVKGQKALNIARSLPKTEKEKQYINAISSFYTGWNLTDHRAQCITFSRAMESMYKKYPEDDEVVIFYALALVAAADPADKQFTNQIKAGSLLTALYRKRPDHPGIVHYIIHCYDYPELASRALPAARKYASIAPSSAHAQHMPSHIFTRMGLWDENIESNLRSIDAAKCYAENAGIKGNWDEELHGMDYLMYAYLQKGNNILAKKQFDYLRSIRDVYPTNFKAAYAFAAIPSRYLLENKMWEEASVLTIHPINFPWQSFPWQKAIIHFTRLLGSAHTGQLDAAKSEVDSLKRMHQVLLKQNDLYKANQVMIQIKAGEALLMLKQGKEKQALESMKIAVDMEDKTEKSPVTPGEVIPASELLGDMLLSLNKPGEALHYFEDDLFKHPYRFNGLYGAAVASEKAGQAAKATHLFQLLLTQSSGIDMTRKEIAEAIEYIKRH